MLSDVISVKVDKPSHSVLYLSTGTLFQHEVGILRDWWRRERDRDRQGETERDRDRERERERGVCNVIHDFSFFKHPWSLEMKFLPCSEHSLGPLHLKNLQP